MDERIATSRTYFYRAKKRITESSEDFDKQFFANGLTDVWASLDAIIGLKFSNIKKFYQQYQSFFETCHKSDVFHNSLEKLVNLSPVQNMKTEKLIHLRDKTNLQELLLFSYAVRGNLHHGRKDLESETIINTRNKELVEHSFKVTYEILEKTLSNEKLI